MKYTHKSQGLDKISNNQKPIKSDGSKFINCLNQSSINLEKPPKKKYSLTILRYIGLHRKIHACRAPLTRWIRCGQHCQLQTQRPRQFQDCRYPSPLLLKKHNKPECPKEQKLNHTVSKLHTCYTNFLQIITNYATNFGNKCQLVDRGQVTQSFSSCNFPKPITRKLHSA